MLKKSIRFTVVSGVLSCLAWNIPVVHAQLKYSNGFEGSTGDVSKMYDCGKKGFTLVNSPKASGNFALRYSNNGSSWGACPEWGGSPLAHRTQTQFGPKSMAMSANDVGPYCIGFSFFVPKETPTYEPFIVWDIKSNTSTFGEPTAFIVRDRLDVRVNGLVENSTKVAFPRGEWFKVVWYVERRRDSGGRHKLWINGSLKLDQKGQSIPSKLSSSALSWFRTGIYFNKDRSNTNYTVYADNVKIAKGSNCYSLVAP
jgi:hypothetical protein